MHVTHCLLLVHTMRCTRFKCALKFCSFWRDDDDKSTHYSCSLFCLPLSIIVFFWATGRGVDDERGSNKRFTACTVLLFPDDRGQTLQVTGVKQEPYSGKLTTLKFELFFFSMKLQCIDSVF